MGSARTPCDPAQSQVAAVIANRRICALCGISFVIVIPPGDPETERDKLCPTCAVLPEPPHGGQSA